MIITLFVTLIVEGLVVIGYSLWRKHPVRPILFTSIFGNLITQSFLWIVLKLFFRHYLAALIIAEIAVWAIESILLASIPANRLRLTDALLLSMTMNMVSFAVGWFLPI